MTDKDVQREIEANERRAREHEDDSDVDEGGLAGAVEDLLDPFDRADEGDAEDRREQNDAEQRRDS